jgi:hypothetical protein
LTTITETTTKNYLYKSIKMHRKKRNYIENRSKTVGIWGRITETKGEVKKAIFVFTLIEAVYRTQFFN